MVNGYKACCVVRVAVGDGVTEGVNVTGIFVAVSTGVGTGVELNGAARQAESANKTKQTQKRIDFVFIGLF